jgi:hypothetical protein
MRRRSMKMTQTDYTTASMTTDVIGLCATSDNPDMWFPEVPQGGVSQKKMMALGTSIAKAINICNRCPKQEACLDEGMKDENLAYGIWGGMIAGDRVIASGKRFRKLSDEGRALISRRALVPWIREWE